LTRKKKDNLLTFRQLFTTFTLTAKKIKKDPPHKRFLFDFCHRTANTFKFCFKSINFKK